MARNKTQNFFWPKITDLQTAKDAAWYGVLAAGCIAVISGFVALITGLLGAVGAMGFSMIYCHDLIIVFIIYVIITWGIYKNSRTAAVAALSILILGFAIITVTTSKLYAPGLFAMLIILMLINSIRGTFAIHKFSQNQVANAVEPDSPERD